MPKAFVLIKVKSGGENDVLQKLERLEGVEETHLVFGDHDIVAKVAVDNSQKLEEIVSEHIKKMDNVSSITKLEVIEK